MKWRSMNNIDILAHIKLAYKLSFAKFSLASLDCDRELYLGEEKNV